MDPRDELAWIAVELTKFGESKIEDNSLVPALRRDLGVGPEHEFFVPAMTYYRHNQPITIHLLEGYVFVASGLPEVKYFALEQRPYVNSVMSTLSGPYRMRSLKVITNDEVLKMKSRLRDLVSSDLEIGSKVKVIDGTYRNLDGKVLEVEGDNASVEVILRSLWVIARVPRVFLETLPE